MIRRWKNCRKTPSTSRWPPVEVLAAKPLTYDQPARVSATRVILLKTREKHWHPNTTICRNFVTWRNLQQPIVLPLLGRGYWFDRTSPTHKNSAKTRPDQAATLNTKFACGQRWSDDSLTSIGANDGECPRREYRAVRLGNAQIG